MASCISSTCEKTRRGQPNRRRLPAVLGAAFICTNGRGPGALFETSTITQMACVICGALTLPC
ncbi:hypothetical protein CU044_7639 [Streptomyces sp. L-9-10]|nr:hypothetical protein CU044_7639 [Streptomyces sp. L-9-10]